jgi:hypothetical protein
LLPQEYGQSCLNFKLDFTINSPPYKYEFSINILNTSSIKIKSFSFTFRNEEILHFLKEKIEEEEGKAERHYVKLLNKAKDMVKNEKHLRMDNQKTND